MNIEELIHGLRDRINPQYCGQLGTESYERQQCVMAIEYLQQENERQRFDILAMNQSLEMMREENKRLKDLMAKRSREHQQEMTSYRLRVKSQDNATFAALLEENERLRNIERAAQWYVDNPNSQRMAISQINAAIDAARGAQ